MSGNGDSAPTVVDLFCGAGGLSLGFRDAGFRIIHAVDNWQMAVETYRANLGDHVTCDSIAASSDLPGATVLAGGPPCQGFSSAGHRRHDDARNSLVAEFAELVATQRPEAFVFENVEGFLTGGNGRFVFELLETVIDAGYCVHVQKINAANYGVPQHRKRVIAIGGLGWAPNFPMATHAAFGAPGAELANGINLAVSTTVADALAILPSPVKRGTGTSDDCHVYALAEGDDLRRAELLSPGQGMRDLPEDLWHQSYRRRAFRRVQDGTPTARRGGPPAGLRRLHPDQPSKAITGGALRDFLHPTQHRLLTIRECSVLQTFPINYEFHGSPTERIQQIGNAVPPLLGRTIAECLKADLANLPDRRVNGSLINFVPTLSNGMSRALQSVLDRIRNRFLVDADAPIQRVLWD